MVKVIKSVRNVTVWFDFTQKSCLCVDENGCWNKKEKVKLSNQALLKQNSLYIKKRVEF